MPFEKVKHFRRAISQTKDSFDILSANLRWTLMSDLLLLIYPSMRLFLKASHGLLTCKGTQKDVGSLTSWSTFHLVNDIKSPTAFLIHIWCLWTNWGRRIQERISINAWFHKFDPNLYCLRTLTHFCLPKALGQWGTCFWKQAFLEEKHVGHKRSVNKAPGGRPFQQGKHTGDHFSKENTQESGWEERKTTPTSENDEQDLFLSDGRLARWKFCKQRILVR